MRQPVRARVLRWFARAGHLDPVDARDMASCDHEGIRFTQLDSHSWIRETSCHRKSDTANGRFRAKSPFWSMAESGRFQTTTRNRITIRNSAAPRDALNLVHDFPSLKVEHANFNLGTRVPH